MQGRTRTWTTSSTMPSTTTAATCTLTRLVHAWEQGPRKVLFYGVRVFVVSSASAAADGSLQGNGSALPGRKLLEDAILWVQFGMGGLILVRLTMLPCDYLVGRAIACKAVCLYQQGLPVRAL